MSGELERRLAELTQERGRVQDSMRRLGEAVASNLDRDALLELVVRTAVDGVGADAGRACVRVNGSGALRRALARGQPERPRDRAAVRRGRRAEQRQRARDDGRRDDRDRPPAARRRGVARGRRRRLRRAATAGRSRRATASCSPTSPARSRARWRTSSCTRRPRATRSPTTSPACRTAVPSTTRSPAEVERSRRFGSELGLVLIDLDDFKHVNDTYGHPQGDVVLREVARVLRESSREIDHPARYGGEELAAVLPGTDLEGAFNRAERVREQIARLRIPRLDGGGTLSVTASCGVAVGARRRPPTARALVQAADTRAVRGQAQREEQVRPREVGFGEMGLLDDAIREHLELKRRRGADAVEISREESEALGPVRRGPDGAPDLSDTFVPGRRAAEPPPATRRRWDSDETAGAGRPRRARRATDRRRRSAASERAAAAALPAARGADRLRAAAGSGRRPTPTHPPYEPPPAPPTSRRRRHRRPPPAPERPWFERAHDGPSRERSRTRIDPGPEPSRARARAPVAARALPRRAPAQGRPPAPPRPRTSRPPSFEPPPLPAATSRPRPTSPRRRASPAYQPPPVHHEPDIVPADDEPDVEDVLEETPDFLEETPEHDRLWFEQRPPRDFDFDD